MQRGRNPDDEVNIGRQGQVNQEGKRKLPKDQEQRGKTEESTPSFPSASSGKTSDYSLVIKPKELNYDDDSFPPTSSSSSSSSASTSEGSESEELSMNPVELAVDAIRRLIPNVPSEFEPLRVGFSNQKIKVDEDDDLQTIFMISTLTEDQKAFLNSGKTQFKKILQVHNQKVTERMNDLDQDIDKLKVAKNAQEIFLKNYVAHWKQNEENRVKLIKIKKALAKAYYQAARDYLNANIAPINQNEGAISSSPTKSISTIVSPTKSGVTSPESSPKKASSIAKLGNSFVRSVQKKLDIESAKIESYDEKFNPGADDDKEENFPTEMALGFGGNSLNVLMPAFEERVVGCSLDQIQVRFNYLLTNFNGFGRVSPVHGFLKTQLEGQAELNEYIQVTYDNDKKIGSLILNENLLRQDRQLIAEDQDISQGNPQDSHIKKINEQFSTEQPQNKALLEQMKQANFVLDRKNNQAIKKIDADKNSVENPVLASVIKAETDLKLISAERKKHLDDLNEKTILYRRYLKIPEFIAELKKQEIESVQLIQENLNKEAAHDQLKLQYQADLASLNAMILEEDARNKIVNGSTGEQPAAQEKKNSKSGAEVSQSSTAAMNAQQASASVGAGASPPDLQVPSTLAQALPASALPVSSQAQGQASSAQVDSQVANAQAASVPTPKSDELEKEYEKIKQNVQAKGDCGFDDQEKRIEWWLDDYKSKNNKIMLDITDANKVKSSLELDEQNFEDELIQKKKVLRDRLQARLTILKESKLSAPCTQNRGDVSFISDEDRLSKEIEQYNIKDSSVADLKLAQEKINELEKRKQEIDALEYNSKTPTASTPTLTTASTSTTTSTQVNPVNAGSNSAELKRKEKQPKYKIYRTPSHQPSNIILFSFWIILVALRSAFEFLLGRKLEDAKPALQQPDTTPPADVAPGAEKPDSSPRKKRKRGSQGFKSSSQAEGSSSTSSVTQGLKTSSGGGSVAVQPISAAASSSPDESKQASSTQPVANPSGQNKAEPRDLKAESAKPTYKDIKNAAFKNPDHALGVRFCMTLFNFAPVPNKSANECTQGKTAARPSRIFEK